MKNKEDYRLRKLRPGVLIFTETGFALVLEKDKTNLKTLWFSNSGAHITANYIIKFLTEADLDRWTIVTC